MSNCFALRKRQRTKNVHELIELNDLQARALCLCVICKLSNQQMNIINFNEFAIIKAHSHIHQGCCDSIRDWRQQIQLQPN